MKTAANPAVAEESVSVSYAVEGRCGQAPWATLTFCGEDPGKAALALDGWSGVEGSLELRLVECTVRVTARVLAASRQREWWES